MSFRDNMIIPVFTTDKAGVILHKNRAAKRCIPSPRTKGNINNYLNNRMKEYRISKDDMRLEFIRNPRSIFNRALVYGQDDRDIWIFLPELQLAEPEDMEDLLCGIMLRSVRSCIGYITEEDSDSYDFGFARYQRIYAELLSAMKRVRIRNDTMYFSAQDILGSLKQRSEELGAACSLRICFDIAFTDPDNIYRINFRTFASVYIHILRFMLRNSGKPVCNVEVTRSGRFLNLSVSSCLKEIKDMPACSMSLERLYRLFPEETPNILFLETCLGLYEYDHSVDISDGILTFRVSVPLDEQKPQALRQSPDAAIIANRFRRAEKRLLEYLDAVFMQI